MSTKEYSDIVWKKNKLYLADIHWCTVIPDTEVSGMWRILWVGDHSLSMDYFNKARTMDNAAKMTVFLNNMLERHARSDLKHVTEPHK